MAARKGRQTPTASVFISKRTSKFKEAIELYEKTGRKCQKWQKNLLVYLLAYNSKGLWVHTKFGYSVPRRNGKSEILVMRELLGLENGEHILHTAHRTTTSHSTWERVCDALNKLGYKSQNDTRKDDGTPEELIYDSYKAYGLESITLRKNGGRINFRTRSSKGGLGEGYDLLIIDEAQEYTDDQASALKYVVTDSKNPQTIYCGTPPTAVSAGTVFQKLRNSALTGEAKNTGWAEWSVEQMTECDNVDAWYETNPSLGTIFTERSVSDEIGNDDIDFNIQRLGLWIKYNQKSAISEHDWDKLQIANRPPLASKLHYGIKFSHDGKFCSMALAYKGTDGKIFVEVRQHSPISAGYGWIADIMARADAAAIVVDGANGQQAVVDMLKERKIKPAPTIPSVKDIIAAGAMFEQGVLQSLIEHTGQFSLKQSATNVEKRAIGSNGGFGYRSIAEDIDVSLVESVVLAYWSAATVKEKKKQEISY